MSSRTLALSTLLVTVATISAAWYRIVDKTVPDPYLDEFFHVPQAQKYCEGDWYSWDPKITTPPGLYIIAWAFSRVTGSCSISALRALNVTFICLVAVQAYEVLNRIHRVRLVSKSNLKAKNATPTDDSQSFWLNANSALNIALFPPLFFFSGLFYTDIMSAYFVLLSYDAHLKRRDGHVTVVDAVKAVAFGIMALLFRQTNIFWVAVFPAGLAVVDVLKRGGEVTTEKATLAVLKDSWKKGLIYDPPLREAGLLDYLLFLLSTSIAGLTNPAAILQAIMPYVVLLGSFAGFVAWNGGVVLGDKSNHVATLHLPQMLYIWPYVALFSFPLLVLPLVRAAVVASPQNKVKAKIVAQIPESTYPAIPKAPSVAVFLALGFAAVHFNTIIHPFTLADNRHYVFYVFRILRRHPAVKYLAVPVYIGCAWLTMQTLALGIAPVAESSKPHLKGKPVSSERRPPCQISFVVVWLATSALSVITAPLVEPRYFIIPWIIWRLQVPSITASARPAQGSFYDLRFSLETAWLLAINAFVGYMFLYRGFSWPSEPGQIQRFLW